MVSVESRIIWQPDRSNQADIEQQCEDAIFLANSTRDWLHGSMPIDMFSDILAEYDVDFSRVIYGLDRDLIVL